jgi:hypothetical protein
MSASETAFGTRSSATDQAFWARARWLVELTSAVRSTLRVTCACLAFAALAIGCSRGGDQPSSAATAPKVSVHESHDSDVKTHAIGDLDDDGLPERVVIRSPASSRISVTLRMSRGLVCANLAFPDKSAELTDVLGSTVLAGARNRALWIAVGYNFGSAVALAHRDGCNLRYLQEGASDLPFTAPVFVYGHVCCPDSVASIRCVPHKGWVELVAASSSWAGDSAHPPSSAQIKAGPHNWATQSLRVHQVRVETLSRQSGYAARRRDLPPGVLDSGLDCRGVGGH